MYYFHYSVTVSGTGKVDSVLAMKDRGITPLILSCTPQKESPGLLNKRLSRSRSTSGRLGEDKIFCCNPVSKPDHLARGLVTMVTNDQATLPFRSRGDNGNP